jgi:hypothetical protein
MEKKGKSFLEKYAQFQFTKGMIALAIAVLIIAFVFLESLFG